MTRKVVFLDRDGTLLWDRPGFYLKHPSRMRLYRETPEALRLLSRAGFRLVILTNQSGLGRGFLDERTLAAIHARLRRRLAKNGVRLDGIYYCPHAPERDCPCRKPKTLLARRALRELGLSLSGAAVIGDKKADVDLARRLGIVSIHLRTGHGRDQAARYRGRLKPTHSARGVLQAARWLLRRNGHGGSDGI